MPKYAIDTAHSPFERHKPLVSAGRVVDRRIHIYTACRSGVVWATSSL